MIVSNQERFVQWFTGLSPAGQREILGLLAQLSGDETPARFGEIDYRRLYFETTFEVARTVDDLIRILQRNEEEHLNQTEIIPFPTPQEPETEK